MSQSYDRPQSLADFLLARIADDEALAGGLDPHAWDPRKVDAECEAKRQVVEYAIYNGPADGYGYLQSVLEILALPYADHPDYQAEWRP